MSATKSFANLVDGLWVAEGAGGTIAVTDPSDVEQTVGYVPSMTPEEVTAVYDAAERGAEVWRFTPVLERAKVLQGAAANLRERLPEIANGLVREMGKTLAEATVEVTKAADFFDYYASLARLPQAVELADSRPFVNVAVRNEPIGIVLAICPWNDPMITPARKLAPALYAGNAVVLKPATDTPIVAIHLAKALHDAGLPAGVLATVTGRTAAIGEALLGDARIAGVTFTGSTEVGLELQRDFAGRNVRIQTEMGGKNASIVLADADLDLAAATVSGAAFAQAGQRCTATSRVIVDKQVVAQFTAKLVEQVAKIKLGPGLQAGTTMGPMVSRKQQASVIEHIDCATAEGGELLIGGGAPADAGLACGCYVEPTVLRGTTEMTIWREEVFGPVAIIVEVDGLEAAIAAANDSIYGLAAAIFTNDLGAAAYFESRANAGQVSINLPTAGWDVHEPFGGFGLSGSAFKEQGLEGLRFYTRVKTVAVRAAR